MSLLKATIGYSFLGQPMANVLWYETVPADPVGIDLVLAAQGLGEWVRDNVVEPAVGETRMFNIHPKGVSYERVSVQVYAPPVAPSANPRELLTAPQVTPINLNTPGTSSEAFSPEVTYRIMLSCAQVTLNPLDYTPAGGYLAIGPAFDGSTLENGEIIEATYTGLVNFTAALLSNADLGGGFTARPIRVGVSKAGRPFPVFGWSPITSASVARKVSWRRSRNAA
ncbi:hypothetical protein [Inoviridae sp.]|nr:hypothetical protein [Inoviridae sp.]